MKALLVYLLLFGTFAAYQVVPSDAEITVIPLSDCSWDGNTTSVVAQVKDALTREDTGPVANSRMVVHCFVDDSDEDENADFNSSSNVTEKHSSTSTDDCSCQLFLVEGLSSKDMDPGSVFTKLGSFLPSFIDTQLILAYWNGLMSTLHYVVIIMFTVRIYQDWTPRRPRDASDEDVVVPLSRSFFSGSSTDSTTTTSLRSPQDTSAKSSSQSDMEISQSSSQSDMEISQLEKLLASGSAVIIKGVYPTIPNGNMFKAGQSSDSSESSYVHDRGNGLGEIYHDSKEPLLTGSCRKSIQRSPRDPIFYTPSVKEESWWRTRSLPSIYYMYHAKETLEDPIAIKDQTEQCDSDAPCSSHQVHDSKESPEEFFTASKAELHASRSSATDFDASVYELSVMSDERLWKSMYNVGAFNDYFPEGLYHSLPCMYQSLMISNVASFTGLTHDMNESALVFEDHSMQPQDDSLIQHCAETEGTITQEGEVKSEDYKCPRCQEIKSKENSDCFVQPENAWTDNLKDDAYRQIIVSCMLHTAKVMLVEFAWNL